MGTGNLHEELRVCLTSLCTYALEHHLLSLGCTNGLMQRTIWRGHRAGLVQRWHGICSRKWSRARRGCGQQSARALRWLRSHTRA